MNLPDYCTLGRGTYYANLTVARWGNERVSVGSYCSIAQQVKLLAGGGHNHQHVSTFPFDVLMRGKTTGSAEDRCYEPGNGIEIGSDVHLGFGSTILGHVKVGHGAVIAAGAVVFSNVPDYAVFGGNPAKLLCWRFDEEWQRKALLKIAWWNWPEEKIRERVDDFYLPVGEFIKKGNMYSWADATPEDIKRVAHGSDCQCGWCITHPAETVHA